MIVHRGQKHMTKQFSIYRKNRSSSFRTLWGSFCVLAICLCSLLRSQEAGKNSGFEFVATEKNFDLYYPTYLANGFFSTNTSLRGTDPTVCYMVGLMDYTPMDLSRPAPIPSWAEIDYFDGVSWLNNAPVDANTLKDYKQTLDMFNGRLNTHYVWVNGGKTSQIDVETFVSQAAPHLAVTSLTVTPDFDGTIRLRFTLRHYPSPLYRIAMGQLDGKGYIEALGRIQSKLAATTTSTPGGSRAVRPNPFIKTSTSVDRAAIWFPGEAEIQDFGGDDERNLIWVAGRGIDGPQFAEAAAIETPEKQKATLYQSAQLVQLEITAKVKKGKSYTFTKYVAASRDGWGGLKDSTITWAADARREGLAKLRAGHEAAWHELWNSDIEVDGDDAVQRAIHSDFFYLLENSTAKTSWAMLGMGFSPNYTGKVFWDNDSWDFPALVLLHPERAKSLVDFRFRTLPAAVKRASTRGYDGAMYPWESDPDNGTEQISESARVFSEKEIHVGADVAIAQWQYYLATGDIDWLRASGYPVIRSVAQFWVSRSTFNAKEDRYEILHVTPPDEAYSDVANDSFTNAVAQKALRAAASAARTLGLTPDPKWEEIARKMYIPFSERDQRHLDFDDSIPHNLHTWMGSSISWLTYPPLDLSMSHKVRQNDFDFSIKSLHELTADANDMLLVMLPIDAAELGNMDESYKWLHISMTGFPSPLSDLQNGNREGAPKTNAAKSYLKPPFNVRTETSSNNAAYILSVSSGFLQDFLYGYTGLRFTDQGLMPVYPPALPTAFKSVTLKGVSFRNARFDYVVSRDSKGIVRLSKVPSTPLNTPASAR